MLTKEQIEEVQLIVDQRLVEVMEQITWHTEEVAGARWRQGNVRVLTLASVKDVIAGIKTRWFSKVQP